MCPIPLNRIENIVSGIKKMLVGGTHSGITVVYNAVTNTMSMAIDYVTKNLKITGGKLNTIQDIDQTSSPEFAGLKLGTGTGLVGKTSGLLNTVSVAYPLTLNNNTLSLDSIDSSVHAIVDENVKKGHVLYLKNTKHVGKGSSVLGTDNFIGLASDDFTSLSEATIVTKGQITLEDWSEVTGSQYLTPTTKYYVSPVAGELTSVIPTTNYLIYVGYALDENTLIIENNLRIKLS